MSNSHRVSVRRTLTKSLLGLGLLAATLPLAGCHRPTTHEGHVEVTRLSVTRRDEQGNPLSTDVELSYLECPGTQTEVLRGGKEFSACVHDKLKVGDKVQVKLEHHWNPDGHYDYDVIELNGCPRTPDPSDEASYKVVRECSDWTANGMRVGFQCDYADTSDLIKKCPWFRKR